MLKIISCKNESEMYKNVSLEKQKTEKKLGLSFGNFIDCELSLAVSNSENISIFNDVNAFLVRVKVGNRGVLGEEEINILNEIFFESLENSPHLFILQGYGAEFEKLCEKKLQEKKELKDIKIIKIAEKVINDFPSDLVASLQKHDKKNSWDLLLKELRNKDAEPIHGSCIFAYKTLLVYLNDTKSNSLESGVKDFSWNQAKRNAIAGKREKQEAVDKYFNLILNYHKARNGEGDLKTQLERWVLEN